MRFPFWKMHGAGNDFILIDDRAADFPDRDEALIARLTSRRTGIGAEGLILLRHSAGADVRMLFFNPDGRRAEMCGNGARCVARLARELGLGGDAPTIETDAGLVRATVRADRDVEVGMPSPRNWRQPFGLEVGGRPLVCAFLNTGVPHAVVAAEAARAWGTDPLPVLGPALRGHPAFGPAGTNVDLYEATSSGTLAVRTWERGVEGETLACGTGVVATALAAFRAGEVRPPVRLRAAGGDLLTVDFVPAPDGGAEQVRLAGPVAHVFEGWFEA